MTRKALRAWAGEKPMSTSMEICSAEGPVEAVLEGASVSRGASMSARQDQGQLLGPADEGGRRTWILHVRKQPLHRRLAVCVAGREQRLLTADQRKAHPFEHAESGLVEGGQAGGRGCDITETRCVRIRD